MTELLLLLLKKRLKWRRHSYKLLQVLCTTHCRQSLTREWLQKKCLFELLSERGEWRCSSNMAWHGTTVNAIMPHHCTTMPLWHHYASKQPAVFLSSTFEQ